MEKLRAAVIGVGYLGRFHAQKYATLPDCTLVGVVDQRPEAAAQVASELGVRALGDYRELFGQVDAVSIVTPTPLHCEMARAFLEHGAHVLVEKPITETVAQAQELIALARQRGRVLQVGHLERFNPVIIAAEPLLRSPRFIECQRLAPFRDCLKDGEPICGRLQPEKNALLYGIRAEDVASSALLPIPGRGLIAVGSRDANRFFPGMGTLFRRMMGDAFDTAMRRFER